MSDNNHPPGDTPEQPKHSPAEAPPVGDAERPELRPPTDTADRPESDQPRSDTNSDIGDRPNLDQPEAAASGATSVEQGQAQPTTGDTDAAATERPSLEQPASPPDASPTAPEQIVTPLAADTGQSPAESHPGPEPIVTPLPPDTGQSPAESHPGPEPIVTPLPPEPGGADVQGHGQEGELQRSPDAERRSGADGDQGGSRPDQPSTTRMDRDVIPREIASVKHPLGGPMFEFDQPLTKDEAARVLFQGGVPPGVTLQAPSGDSSRSTHWQVSGMNTAAVVELNGALTTLVLTHTEFNTRIGPTPSSGSDSQASKIDQASPKPTGTPQQPTPSATDRSEQPPGSEPPRTAEQGRPEAPGDERPPEAHAQTPPPEVSSQPPRAEAPSSPPTSDSDPSSGKKDQSRSDADHSQEKESQPPSDSTVEDRDNSTGPGSADTLAAIGSAVVEMVDTLLDTLVGSLGDSLGGPPSADVGPRSAEELREARQVLKETLDKEIDGARDPSHADTLQEQYAKDKDALINQYVANAARDLTGQLGPTVTDIHAKGNEIWATVHDKQQVPQYEGSSFGVIGVHITGYKEVATSDEVRLYKFDTHYDKLATRTLYERQPVENEGLGPLEYIGLPKLGVALTHLAAREIKAAAGKVASKVWAGSADDALGIAAKRAGKQAGENVDNVGVSAGSTAGKEADSAAKAMDKTDDTARAAKSDNAVTAGAEVPVSGRRQTPNGGEVYDKGLPGRRPGDPQPGIQQGYHTTPDGRVLPSFEWSDTNIQRMLAGKPPFGADGKQMVLHHRGQSPHILDEYTYSTHKSQHQLLHDNDISRHDLRPGGRSSPDPYPGQRQRYWIERARMYLDRNDSP